MERIDSCASMYSRSIQGHHVCLLVKTVSEPMKLLPLFFLQIIRVLKKWTGRFMMTLIFSLSLLTSFSQSGQTVSIDAKCDEPTLLGNVLDEIKQTFSQC